MNNIFDTLIMRIFQSISDFCQDWFGINNFLIAKLCLVMALSLNVTILVFSVAWNLGYIASVLFSFITMVLWLSILLAERTLKLGFQNYLYIGLASIRTLFAFLQLLIVFGPLFVVFETTTEDSLFGLFSKQLFLALTLAAFFGSCTPKPFSPNKLKQLLTRIHFSPKVARA